MWAVSHRAQGAPSPVPEDYAWLTVDATVVATATATVVGAVLGEWSYREAQTASELVPLNRHGREFQLSFERGGFHRFPFRRAILKYNASCRFCQFYLRVPIGKLVKLSACRQSCAVCPSADPRKYTGSKVRAHRVT